MSDGGPAYPTYGLTADRTGHLTNVQTYSQGMSLRDYFAAQALTGVLAMCADPDAAKPTNEDAAGMAYDYADAMLAQRGKGKEVSWPSGQPIATPTVTKEYDLDK